MSSTFKASPISMILRDDIAARASLLAGRLEKKEYRPETISAMDVWDWPGDWEGRTILGLTRLAVATKKEPAYLHDIVKATLNNCNERGYMGMMLPAGEAHEQQLSGNGWLLRGLIAYYQYTGKKEIYDAAVRLGQNLYLPLIELYKNYPGKPEERVYAGGESGNVAGVVRGWRISTDTGCAFIAMDGVSALYELTGDKALGELLSVMVSQFIKLDYESIGAQTHATLTSTRAILRMYRITGEKWYLDEAIRIYDLYTTCGMTASYENYNWFGRRAWTEPCTVIDSFLCAMQLYTATRERKYVTLAQRIYFNGMGFGQRENGGFGCDSGLGATGVANNHIIEKHCEEAYWCCTMRGGEGLASVGEYAYLTDDGARTVTVPYFISNDVTLDIAGEKITLSARTRYPYKSSANYEILENGLISPITMQIYLPDTAENVKIDGAAYKLEGGFAYITVDASTKNISIAFDLPLTLEIPHGKYNDKDRVAIFYGNAIMSMDAKEEVAALGGTVSDALKEKLHLLFDAYEQGHAPRRALFEN